MDGELGVGGPQHIHYGQIPQHHQGQHPHHHEFQEAKQEEWNAYHHMQQHHLHHHEEQLHLHQHHAAHHHLHQHQQLHLQHPHQPHMVHPLHSHHHHHQPPQLPPQQHLHRHALPPGAEQLANGHIHHPAQPMTPQGPYQHHPQHVHPQPVHHFGALPVPVDPPAPMSVGGPSTGSTYMPDPSSQQMVQHQQLQHAHPHHHQPPRSVISNGHLQHAHQQQVAAAAAASAAAAATDHYLNPGPHPLHDMTLQQQQHQQQQLVNHHHQQHHHQQQQQQQQQVQAMEHGQLGGEGPQVQVQPAVAVPTSLSPGGEQQQQQQQQQPQGVAPPPSHAQNTAHDVPQGQQPSPSQQQRAQQTGQMPVALPAMHLQAAVEDPALGSLQAAVAAAAALDGGAAARDARQPVSARAANNNLAVNGTPGMRASAGAAVGQAEGVWGDAMLGVGAEAQPRSKRPRPATWSPEEELHLVSLYSTLSQKKHDSRKNLWDGVVAGLSVLGYDRRLQSVVQRWSQLQATHRALAGYLAALPGGSTRFWGARAVDRKQIFQALKCNLTLDQRVWEALNEVLKEDGAAAGGSGGGRGTGGGIAVDDATAAGAQMDDAGLHQPAQGIQQQQQPQEQQEQLLEAGMAVDPDADDEALEAAGTGAVGPAAKRRRRNGGESGEGGEQGDGKAAVGVQARLEAPAAVPNDGMVLGAVEGSAGGAPAAHGHRDAAVGVAGGPPAAPVTPAAVVMAVPEEREVDRVQLEVAASGCPARARQERQTQPPLPQQQQQPAGHQRPLQPDPLGEAPEEVQQVAPGSDAQQQQPLVPVAPTSLQQQQMQAIQALQQAQQAIQAQIKAAFTPLLSGGGGVSAVTRPLLPVPQLLSAAPLLAASPLLSNGPLLSALAAGTTGQQLSVSNPGTAPGSAATMTLLGPGAAAAATSSGGVIGSRVGPSTGGVGVGGPNLPSVQGLAALASATQAAAAAAVARRDAVAAAEAAAAQAALLDCDGGAQQLPGRVLMSSITRNVVLKMAEADQLLGRTSAAETDRARGYVALISECLHLLPLIRKQEAQQVHPQLSPRVQGPAEGATVDPAVRLARQQELGRLERGRAVQAGLEQEPLAEPFAMQPQDAMLTLQAAGERSSDVDASHSLDSEQQQQPSQQQQQKRQPASSPQQLVRQDILTNLPQPHQRAHPAALLPAAVGQGSGLGVHSAEGDFELEQEQQRQEAPPHQHQHGILLQEGSQVQPQQEPAQPVAQPPGTHLAQQQQ